MNGAAVTPICLTPCPTVCAVRTTAPHSASVRPDRPTVDVRPLHPAVAGAVQRGHEPMTHNDTAPETVPKHADVVTNPRPTPGKRAVEDTCLLIDRSMS
jgi:hypothetical protein